MGSKLFKFLIAIFLLLNFATLIFGYIIFLDFSNSQKSYYSNQINLYSQKENLILKDINSLKISYNNYSSNVIDLKSRIKIIESGASSNVSSSSNSLKNVNIVQLTSQLDLLTSKENKLILERSSLYSQYQQKLARQQSRRRVVTRSS